MRVAIGLILVLLAGCQKKPEVGELPTAQPPQTTAPAVDVGRTPEVEPGAIARAVELPCAERPECLSHGQCAETEDGCAPTSHEHCAKSKRCAEDQRCYHLDGHCEEASELVCYDHDFVGVMRDGDCVVPTCDSAFDLALVAKGAESEERTGCVADGVSCTDTVACKEQGFCGTDGKHCVLNDVGCRALPECANEGACAAANNGCFALTFQDCKQSEACKKEGRCRASGGTCIEPESCELPRVSVAGVCELPVGYDCAEECQSDNRCEPYPREVDGEKFVVCVETAAYCRDHADCRVRGLCGRHLGTKKWYNKCYDTWPGACEYEVWGGCKKTEEGCLASKGCKTDGNCSAASTSMYCRPTRAEHCEKSEICKREGQCKLLDESSYHICGD